MARLKSGGYVLHAQSAETAALGRKFRALRERSGLGLVDLASNIGRSFYVIRRHEAGHTMLRADDLIAAARVLKVQPCELLTPEPVE